ncbi:MAG: MATE family efflux transporter [Phycisphaeraceae bacterium]|nr:MATE family efflux transporter [Phycisphaeraceae bacterium]
MATTSPITAPLDPETLDPSLEVAPPILPSRPPRTPGITPDGRLISGRLAGLTMWGAIRTLSWPILAQSFLTALVGLTDTVLAAGVSSSATDAIGGAAYVLWLVGIVVMAIGVGATALISRSVGGRRFAVANAALGQSILLAAISGVGMALLVAALSVPLASVLSLTGPAKAEFFRYILVSCLGVPMLSVLSAGIECARAAGDSYRPLKSMVLVNVINMAVSWILAGVDLTRSSIVNGQEVTHVILHNPFPFHLGVTGIALGTVIAQAAGAAVILRLLVSGSPGIVLRRKRLRPHWHTMRRILRVGFPNFLETLGMWAGNFLIAIMVGWIAVQQSAGGDSSGLLGAHIVAVRIESFSFLTGLSLGTAAAALTGQYLGAGSPRMARRSALACTGLAAAIMALTGAAFMLIPRQITGLVSSQPIHLEIVPQLLFITGTIQVPFAVAIVLRSALRGAGDVKVVMWITWITTYGIRLPLAYALSGADIPLPGGGLMHNPFWSGGGLAGLWIGLCIEIVLRAAMFLWRFVQGGWLSMRV